MVVSELVELFAPDTKIIIYNQITEEILWEGYAENYNWANGLSERYNVVFIEAVDYNAVTINVIDTLEAIDVLEEQIRRSV